MILNVTQMMLFYFIFATHGCSCMPSLFRSFSFIVHSSSPRVQRRDHTAQLSYAGYEHNADGGMDESRVGVVLGTSSDLKDVLDAQGRSALELATSSRCAS